MRRGRWARVLGEIFSLACLCGIAGLAFAPTLMESDAEMRAPAAVQMTVAPAQPIAAQSTIPVASSAPLDIALTTTAPPRILREGPGLQCAIYARQRTNVSLSGAARAWWDQAEGRYRRSHAPEAGAVMAMGGTPSGHVAVVARVINAREILIDHANWMGGGEIILGAPALDVSPANDWSQVRVWHPPTNSLGLRPYPVQGFIHPGAEQMPAVQKA